MERLGESARNRLRARLAEFKELAACEALRQQIEPRITEWRFATDAMLGVHPCYKLLYPKGRWLKSGPGEYKHGFDQDGKLCLIRDRQVGHISLFHTLEEGLLEEFTYRGAETVVEAYRRGASFVRHHAIPANGQIAWTLNLHEQGEEEVHFQWLDGRLRGYLTRQVYNGSESFTQTDVSYAEDGKVERLTSQLLKNGQPSGAPEVRFQRKQKGETPATLGRSIEAILLAAIPEALRKAGLAHPVDCIFLEYCSSGWDLLPGLMLATEMDRARVSSDVRWYPGEVEGQRIPLEHPLLKVKWLQFSQSLDDFAPALKLLRKVAATLNKTDLTALLPVTPNCVVTSADSSDGVEVEEDLRACLTPAQRKRLQIPS